MSLPVSPRREVQVNGTEAEAGLSPAVVRVLVENRRRFLSFLERRVGRRDLAEELLQEAFTRGIARGRTLRNDESVVAWFYRLLRNVMVDQLRRQAAEARGRAAFAREESVAGADPDQELVDTICACVGSLVDTLRPDYAAAIQRVDLGGESLQSFATAAHITRGNAAVRLFRARQALRRRVEQSCGTCATHGCYQCECAAQAHAPR
jgi:RNA polymerase sigma factor (sigma-70 family)